MRKIEYVGTKVHQRPGGNSPEFFAFYAPAKEICLWAGVVRTKDVSGGVQRALRDSRLSGIRKFLKSDTRNTFPNNILIAFSPGTSTYDKLPESNGNEVRNSCDENIELGKISFQFDPDWTDSEKPAVVVDGQHRLFGAASFDDENIPFLVVALLDAPPVEQAFQFIVINNKAVKVPTTTVKSIVADYEELEENLINRLIPAGISYGKKSPFLTAVDDSPDSPFQTLLDWDRNREGAHLIAVTAVESMLSYLKKELYLVIDRDEDSAQEILFWIWNRISELYADLWSEKNQQFFSKVNLVAMNEYCVGRLRGLASMQMLDLFNESEVAVATASAFRNIPSEFWMSDWSIQIQDNKVIRELLKESFEAVATNCMKDRAWNTQIRLFAEDE
ncbi:MAG: hypothetical protein CMO55_07905 [Verrucomicrobiales bacterium]|nr:hypothetical protein [Verrucomicrobiales bacterium]